MRMQHWQRYSLSSPQGQFSEHHRSQTGLTHPKPQTNPSPSPSIDSSLDDDGDIDVDGDVDAHV